MALWRNGCSSELLAQCEVVAVEVSVGGSRRGVEVLLEVRLWMVSEGTGDYGGWGLVMMVRGDRW